MRACGFQRHKHGATKSDEDDQKNHTETSHVTVDDLGESLGIQTSSSRRKTNIDLTQAKNRAAKASKRKPQDQRF